MYWRVCETLYPTPGPAAGLEFAKDIRRPSGQPIGSGVRQHRNEEQPVGRAPAATAVAAFESRRPAKPSLGATAPLSAALA